MQRQRAHTCSYNTAAPLCFHRFAPLPLLIMCLFLLHSSPIGIHASSAFVPTIRDVPELTTDMGSPATFTLILGHNRPGYDLSRIRFQITSSDQNLLQNSLITSRGTGSNRIVSALPTTSAGERRALVPAECSRCDCVIVVFVCPLCRRHHRCCCCSSCRCSRHRRRYSRCYHHRHSFIFPGAVTLIASATDAENVTVSKNISLIINPLQAYITLHHCPNLFLPQS
jgi:hypothetical protein